MSRLNFNKLRHYINSSLLVGDVTTGSEQQRYLLINQNYSFV
jgi:hypothetical protein